MEKTTIISYGNLCLEITRRCNMACAHCLRGDAQNVDMSHEIIDRALENVLSIGSLTFTGGEPSLNVDAMRYTLEKCEEEGIFVNSFYVVTNGKCVTQEFLSVLTDWYIYCVEYGGEAEMCGVALSKDQFHDTIPMRNELLLRAFSFFDDSKIHADKKTGWILGEGRAQNIPGAQKFRTDCLPQLYVAKRDDDGNAFVQIEDLIYISADGKLVNGCDWSYANQTQHQLGTVYDRDGWLKKLGFIKSGETPAFLSVG